MSWWTWCELSAMPHTTRTYHNKFWYFFFCDNLSAVFVDYVLLPWKRKWYCYGLIIVIYEFHNIIHIHNSVVPDWQYFLEYFSHSVWMWGIFCRRLSVSQNIAMGLNNVMNNWVSQSLFCGIDNILWIKFPIFRLNSTNIVNPTKYCYASE